MHFNKLSSTKPGAIHDEQADRMLRSIEQNKGQLSNVLAKEIPLLERPGIWEAVVGAVDVALRQEGAPDVQVVERYHPLDKGAVK